MDRLVRWLAEYCAPQPAPCSQHTPEPMRLQSLLEVHEHKGTKLQRRKEQTELHWASINGSTARQSQIQWYDTHRAHGSSFNQFSHLHDEFEIDTNDGKLVIYYPPASNTLKNGITKALLIDKMMSRAAKELCGPRIQRVMLIISLVADLFQIIIGMTAW